MEEEKKPIGLLFNSVGYNTPNDVDRLTDEMNVEQSIYIITQALDYVHSTRLLTMQETELVSKSLRILHKVVLNRENQSDSPE